MTTNTTPPARKRLDSFEAVYQVAQLTVKRSLKGWRPLVSLAVVALPALLGVLVRAKGAHAEDQERFFYAVLARYHFGIALPFVALVFATSFPWPESEEGTLTYWFTSPIPRWTVLLGRFLAAVLIGSAVLSLGVLAVGLPLATAPEADTGGVMRAALASTLLAYPAYLALFQIVATVFRHGLVFGVCFIVIENFMTVIPGSIVRLTLSFYVRSQMWTAVPLASQPIAASKLHLPDPASTAMALAAFCGVTVVCLLVSLLAVSVIEYRGRTSQQG